MNAEEFRDLVIKDIKGEATEEDLTYLAANVRNWLWHLNSIKRDVEMQFTAQKARISTARKEMQDRGASQSEWLEFKEKEDNWRVNAARFGVSVEQRIIYAKSRRANQAEMAAAN